MVTPASAGLAQRSWWGGGVRGVVDHRASALSKRGGAVQVKNHPPLLLLEAPDSSQGLCLLVCRGHQLFSWAVVRTDYGMRECEPPFHFPSRAAKGPATQSWGSALAPQPVQESWPGLARLTWEGVRVLRSRSLWGRGDWAKGFGENPSGFASSPWLSDPSLQSLPHFHVSFFSVSVSLTLIRIHSF